MLTLNPYIISITVLISVGLLSSCNNSSLLLEERVSQVEDKLSDEAVLMRVNQTTTRDKCTSCGCKADLINCTCSTQKQRDCLSKKGQQSLIIKQLQAIE